MDKIGILLFPFFLFLFSEISIGQENYAIKTFTTDQGLPHNNVHDIAQDKNGFLWIATWDGLSRYDGYEFRNYYHNPQDSTSLIYFTADKVLVDYKNQVWIKGASAGLSMYDRSKDNFIRFEEHDVLEDISLDQEKKLWILSDHYLKRWDYINRRFTRVDIKLEYGSSNKVLFQYVDFDNKNGIWLNISDANGQMYFMYCDDASSSPLKFRFLGKYPLELIKPLPSNSYYSYFPMVSSSGNFWILNNYRLCRLDPADQVFKVWKGIIPEEEFKGISAQFHSDFLQKMKYYDANLKLSGETADSSFVFVESVCTDRQGITWLSRIDNGKDATGLTRIIETPKWFRHYFTDFNTNRKLVSVFPVLKDKIGTLWAGPSNRNGLLRITSGGKVYQPNQMNQKLLEDVRNPRVFFEDSAGIWIGYFNHLLQYYDFLSGKYTTKILKKTSPEDLSLPEHYIHITRDGQDLILFGFWTIYRYQPNTGKCTLLKKFGDRQQNYSFYRDKNGDWWLGFGGGQIGHFDKDFKLIRHYAIKNSMFNVETIMPGENNDLWLTLLGGGLAHFDIASGKSEILTTANGLSNNTCYGILKDKNGNLWISTNHGISRFNPKTRQFRAFGPEDGLKIDEFNSDATFQAPDGEMYFGGMGGVVSFYPDSIQEHTDHIIAPLVITDFKVSGMPRYFKKAVYEMDTVSLTKGDNNFQLSFACLDFRNSDKVKYRYRLSGESNEFVETDHQHRSVNYSNLVPGEYRLEIGATNWDGEWVSQTALLIIIPSFYYQTIGFRLLIILLLFLLAAYLIYSYNHQIILKAKQKQEELRLESLRGQMNPHFIFNSLNSINYFISKNDRLSANRYIADFSRLIRSILGNMANDYILFEKELDSLNDYLRLEHLRFGDKFDYSIHVSEGISTETLMVFPGMVQPFVENAIWHGVRGLESRKGIIRIEFRLINSGYLHCVVEDDGVGRKHSEKCKSNLPGKTSRGISIVLERLKIINNLRQTNFQVKIEDTFADREETGTRVTIDIPVKA